MASFIENMLIEHCSPTLAGIKIANLFSVSKEDRSIALEELEYYRALLFEKGIEISVLGNCGLRFLVYVYRKNMVQKLLKRDDIRLFLKNYGYELFDIKDVLSVIDHRICNDKCFPHEIGVLLGYPLKDVEGFIRQKGQGCICSGCWKAYGDKCEAEKCFLSIDKCRCEYKRLYREGASIYDLTAYAV